MMGSNMEGGFKFLFGGIVLVALAFSLMSVWPALTETSPRHISPQAKAQPPLHKPAANLPLAGNPPGQGGAQTQRGKPIRPAGLSTQPPTSLPGLVVNAQPLSREVTEVRQWIYTKKRVTLLKEPGGAPHRSFSINHAELEIMGGTRLTSVRSEDGWLLVRSPSKLYGWLREADVSTRAPVSTDTEWKQFPSE